MGSELNFIDNGTPKRHCHLKCSHPRHHNINPTDGTYCDGVPEVEPFLELTVRASIKELFGEMNLTHEQALHLVGRYGLGMLIDCIGKPETAMVLRVRVGEKDQVYPLLKDRLTSGYKAVVDAPGV